MRDVAAARAPKKLRWFALCELPRWPDREELARMPEGVTPEVDPD